MVKEFHYREATGVSSFFPGACVCGLAAAFHAAACDVLLLTSCHSLCQGVGQETMDIYAMKVVAVFTAGKQICLVQRPCAVTFLHQRGCQRVRGKQRSKRETVQCF